MEGQMYPEGERTLEAVQVLEDKKGALQVKVQEVNQWIQNVKMGVCNPSDESVWPETVKKVDSQLKQAKADVRRAREGN
uniref:Uncharacterized protein n=1 Tax=Chromera velia CCMP2878 TaxID=1169474 RepID=A0A0G4G7Z8_9ALVE|eukprot:Cvel_20701.t1-p1 / transcript=Cvel_20701.t1 / gene=Cvel_20701 / organism=Chromera_velia_CCMP2878 / gene_product=hypothetical protein / transcript_product=hypothetical protein / location=Cvel_scaffold1884:5838-6071(-) / protein_length=78 / sequence_SO=supercontig / SO=protein_coding / is_pseudo=false